MNGGRLQQLEAMLSDEPGDTFLRYAIALEHRRLGDFRKATDLLEQLMREVPSHVATYYQLALLLADQGRLQDALAACDAGMLQSLVNADRKARSELNELKQTLLDSQE